MAFSVSSTNSVGIAGNSPLSEAVRKHFEPSGTLATWPAEADIVFVCAATSFRPRTGLDDREVEEVVAGLDGSKVIVLMAALQPGATEAYQYRYPQHCFLFNPSFARLAHIEADFRQPDRQIVGYTAQSRHLAETVAAMLPKAPYSRTVPAREAELAKLVTSALLAVKVTFANEVFDLCSALDAEYDLVRDAVAADSRIGASHLDVFDGGYRGYAGAGLPREVKSLLEVSERLGVPLRVLTAASQVNFSLLPPGEAPALRPVPIAPDNGGNGDDSAGERAA